MKRVNVGKCHFQAIQNNWRNFLFGGQWTSQSWGTRFECMWDKSEQDCLKDSLWYQKDWPHLGPEFSFYVIPIFSLCSTHFSQITSDSCPLTLRRGTETHTGAATSPFQGRNSCKHERSTSILSQFAWAKLGVSDTARHIPWSLQPQLQGFWMKPTGGSVVSALCSGTGPSADHSVS